MILLLREIGDFATAVLLAWWSTPLAALLAGGAALFEAIREKKITKRVWIVLGVSYLIFAFFAVWRDEHKRALEMKAKMEDVENRNSPKLDGRIEQLAFGTDTNLSETNTTITMVMSIGNQGTPSIAENWSLRLDIPNSSPIELGLPYVPNEMTLLDDNRKPMARFGPSDLLFNKTETIPIPTGSRVRGIVFCSLKGYERDSLMRARPRLTVKYHDVTGRLYETSHQMGQGETLPGATYFPGTQWGVYAPNATPYPARPKSR